MAGPSSRLDDSDMLEYLDTTDSDSDEDDPNVTPLAAHPVSDSEEDEDYTKLCHLSKLSLFLSNSKNCMHVSICLLLILLLLTSISSSQT
jgi:hypothetical protein